MPQGEKRIFYLLTKKKMLLGFVWVYLENEAAFYYGRTYWVY